MARPRKTGLDYFPFDVDFFSDEKVVCIGGEYKIKGELTIIKLLCAIYRNGYYIRWNDTLKYKLVTEMHGTVSGECLEQIVRRLVERGIFDENLFLTASVLTSEGIQRRYFEAAKFRQRDQDLPFLLVIPTRNYTKSGISQWETPVSQQISTQMRRNKIKISSDEDTKRGASSPPYEEKNFLKEFFGDDTAANSERRSVVVRYARSLGFASPEEMREMAEEVVEDWRVRRHTPRDWEDAASHLISTIKKKKAAASTAATPPETPVRKKPTASTGLEAVERQMKERTARWDEMERNKAKPDEVIRRYGYDPAKVTMAQVFNPEWRAANPPEFEPTFTNHERQ